MNRSETPMSRRGFLGAAIGGTTAAGAAGTATAQEGTGAEQTGARHAVEMTDDLVFDPDAVTVAPGDTVVWENVGTVGHSVTAYEDEIPEGATYFASGGFDSEDAARRAYSAGDPDSGDVPGGESYEHTFEVEGTYEYFCIPHESVGMLGTVTVTPGGASGGDGGGGGDGAAVPQVPNAARTLAIATAVGLLGVIALAYFFLKYGGDYDIGDE